MRACRHQAQLVARVQARRAHAHFQCETQRDPCVLPNYLKALARMKGNMTVGVRVRAHMKGRLGILTGILVNTNDYPTEVGLGFVKENCTE